MTCICRFHIQDSTNLGLKSFFFFSNFRKSQRAKLEFASLRLWFIQHLHWICNYWHNIYIVLGVISRDDLKYRGRCTWVICKYYTIWHKGLEHFWLWESVPHRYSWTTVYTIKMLTALLWLWVTECWLTWEHIRFHGLRIKMK